MIELGLKRISQLVKDCPLSWKAVHIAGTNGKGSTAAYLSSLLHHQGIAVGRFTSPHVVDRWDCISIRERTVSKSLFESVEKEVKQANDGRHLQATEFEILTATAFQLFNLEGVSVGVIECGMGGARDATNVLQASDVLVSVVTKIGLDHQNLLGSNLQEIAWEKGGIFKDGPPIVVDGTNMLEVKKTLRSKARSVNNRFYFETSPSPKPDFLDKYGLASDDAQKLLAPHQRSNLIVALSAFETVRRNRSKPEDQKADRHSPVPKLDAHEESPDMSKPRFFVRKPSWYKKIDLKNIITQAHKAHPGRLQWLSIRSITGRWNQVLLDGAHNIQSAEALSTEVDEVIRKSQSSRSPADQPITWVIAMSKGKDVSALLKPLLRYGDNVIVTRFGPVDGMPWVESEDPERIRSAAEMLLRAADVETKGPPGFMDSLPQVWSALGKASQLAGDAGPLVITGSLYLVSDVLRMLRNPPASLDREDQNKWVEQQRSALERREEGIFDSNAELSSPRITVKEPS